MTVEELENLFLEHPSLKFDQIPVKLSNRPDLHAFLLLDKLVPGTDYMIVHADFEYFSLGIELEELAKVATENDIRELSCCGVHIDNEALCMFASLFP